MEVDFLHRINRKIDEFCRAHPGFGIPNLMKIIVIGTALVYVLYMLTGYNASAISFLSFDLAHLLRGEVWRIVTFLFVPNTGLTGSMGGAFWLIISLFFYYFLGSALEREWGTAKFNIYYFSGTVLSLLCVIVFSLLSGVAFSLSGTYYVNMSMFFAFAMLYPETTILFWFIPIKIKYLAWISGALFVIDILSALLQLNFAGALLPVVALLNFFIFFADDLFAWLRRITGRAAHQASPKTIQYKKAVKEQKKEKGYHHKCAVCGKTDTDYPDLDFRYCSKCNGYYCYCSEHINNHVHITTQP